MTQDEQNEIDITRMMSKRSQALKLLDDFKEWHIPEPSSGDQLIVVGLTRDILRGTEDEVDLLIERLEERNQMAFIKKLSEGVM